MGENIKVMIDKTFAASPAELWSLWTEKEPLSHWYGPGVETVIHSLEVKPGGFWQVEMRMPQFSSFQRAEYIEVTAPQKLIFDMAMTDADWHPVPNPQMPDWPDIIRHEVTFSATDAGTHLHLSCAPFGASEAQIACFMSVAGGMAKGWGAGMELLEQMLGNSH